LDKGFPPAYSRISISPQAGHPTAGKLAPIV